MRQRKMASILSVTGHPVARIPPNPPYGFGADAVPHVPNAPTAALIRTVTHTDGINMNNNIILYDY